MSDLPKPGLLDGVRVSGRGIRKPTVAAYNESGGLRLRVDDDDRPEFWLEICVPADVLFGWYEDQRSAERYGPPEAR